MHVAAGLAAHDLHVEIRARLAAHPDPHENATVCDLLRVVVPVMPVHAACGQRADHGGRAAADRNGRDRGRERAGRCQQRGHRDAGSDEEDPAGQRQWAFPNFSFKPFSSARRLISE